jgi:hypothetical protein
MTVKRRRVSGIPLSLCSPRSSNSSPDPATRSRVVAVTSTSLGAAQPATRAPTCTAIPRGVARPRRVRLASDATDSRVSARGARTSRRAPALRSDPGTLRRRRLPWDRPPRTRTATRARCRPRPSPHGRRPFVSRPPERRRSVDRPVPRLSNRMSRAKDPNRSRKRAWRGSSQSAPGAR